MNIFDIPEEERDEFLCKIDKSHEEWQEYLRLLDIYFNCFTARQQYDFWSSIFPNDYKDIPYPELSFWDCENA